MHFRHALQVLIDHVLKTAGLREAFSAIYTNPAKFDASGCLTLEPYHNQNWCAISTDNLCKGHILDQHPRTRYGGVDKEDYYDVIIYIGDGTNDLCPARRLRQTDLVFARRGYKLAAEIEKEAARGGKGTDAVKARVVLWDTGFDIIREVNKELNALRHRYQV